MSYQEMMNRIFAYFYGTPEKCPLCGQPKEREWTVEEILAREG